MLLKRNSGITTIIFLSTYLQAVNISTQFLASEGQLSFSGTSLLTPGIVTKSPHHMPIKCISPSLQASIGYSSLVNIVSEIGVHYPISNAQLFASGSLTLSPKKFNPFIGIGGKHIAQNDASISLIANIGYFSYDLETSGLGTLFNGYSTVAATRLHLVPTDIKLDLTYPITEGFQTVIGFSYGLDFWTSKLPLSAELIPTDHASLLEEPTTPKATLIGDFFGKEAQMHMNKISAGIQLNIKEF